MTATPKTTPASPPADLDGLLAMAQQRPKARLGVVAAEDDTALLAVAAAAQLDLVTPVLIGSGDAIRARIETRTADDAAGAQLLDVADFIEADDPAASAAIAAARGEADILLKGALRTDQLLRAILNPDAGLRTGRLLSDILLYEDTLGDAPRLVAITDGGITIAPTLEHKREIVVNSVEILHKLGFSRPRIAIMSATEAVSKALSSTLDAEQLTLEGARGDFGACEVYGPLALDNALLPSAAAAKGIDNPVAGYADCLVAPSIEAGNLLGKSAKFFAGSRCAHAIVGAAVPILIPSRVESAEDKLMAIALGLIAIDHR